MEVNAGHKQDEQTWCEQGLRDPVEGQALEQDR